LAKSPNLFAYVSNRPTILVDPTGLDDEQPGWFSRNLGPASPFGQWVSHADYVGSSIIQDDKKLQVAQSYAEGVAAAGAIGVVAAVAVPALIAGAASAASTAAGGTALALGASTATAATAATTAATVTTAVATDALAIAGAYQTVKTTAEVVTGRDADTGAKLSDNDRAYRAGGLTVGVIAYAHGKLGGGGRPSAGKGGGGGPQPGRGGAPAPGSGGTSNTTSPSAIEFKNQAMYVEGQKTVVLDPKVPEDAQAIARFQAAVKSGNEIGFTTYKGGKAPKPTLGSAGEVDLPEGLDVATSEHTHPPGSPAIFSGGDVTAMTTGKFSPTTTHSVVGYKWSQANVVLAEFGEIETAIVKTFVTQAQVLAPASIRALF
jgi:hypothetical protein